jgi:hypothetical protein
MKMLILRSGRHFDQLRACVPIVRTKTSKYGQVLDEHWLPTRRDWMILGANAAGKTRWLQRLHSHAPAIWRDKPALLLRAVDPIGAWTADPRIKTYMEAASGQPWSKAKCWERAEWLIRWAKAHHAVLLLDDAHHLSGRKLDIAQRLALVAGRIVSGASQESRIPINLRMTLLQRDPVIETLKSDAAYDATAVFLWLLILAAMGAGAWQLAAILGGMKFLGRGSRAARQT